MKRLTFTLLASSSALALAQTIEPGTPANELIRQASLVFAIIAIILLVLVEFVFKSRIARGSYYLLLFIGLFGIPAFTMTGTTSTLFEETKTVESCNSCHIMEPFVDDMQNPQSATLAARHFRHKWIEKDQCYHCHTAYGVHGDIAAKRDGFRHWLMYVTNTYPDPIRFVGSYPNSNCFACHDDTPKYEVVPSHLALEPQLAADEVSCTSCHGPPHPTPGERAETGTTSPHRDHHAGSSLSSSVPLNKMTVDALETP